MTAMTRSLDDPDFDFLRALVERRAGIAVGPHKRAFLEARIGKRLRALGLASYGDYRELLSADPAEETELLEAVCTHETRFFRHGTSFGLLASEASRWAQKIARGEKAPRIRVLSAGCATGEEAYSAAMTLLSRFPEGSGTAVEIHAVDLSSKAIATARAATYPIASARHIPEGHRRAFALEGTGEHEGLLRIGPAARSVVRFEQANLTAPREPGARRQPWEVGPFDAIFCAHVLMFLTPEAKLAVVARLAELLDPWGLLFVGAAESLAGAFSVRKIGLSAYGRAHHLTDRGS